jgi:hypothetical protein
LENQRPSSCGGSILVRVRRRNLFDSDRRRRDPICFHLPHDIVRQQYHFSPSGATEEIEEYRVEFEDVTALELTIIPNLSGGSYASLAQLRLA